MTRYTSEMTREEFDREVMQTRVEKVKGNCPACGGEHLFVGDGGYLTCSLIGCPDPTAAHRLLEPASDELWHGVPRRPASCGEAIYDAGPYDEMAIPYGRGE